MFCDCLPFFESAKDQMSQNITNTAHKNTSTMKILYPLVILAQIFLALV